MSKSANRKIVRQLKESHLHISSLNTTISNADLSTDVANGSLGCLMDYQCLDLIIPEITDVPSASLDGLIVLKSLESDIPLDAAT